MRFFDQSLHARANTGESITGWTQAINEAKNNEDLINKKNYDAMVIAANSNENNLTKAKITYKKS